MKSRIVLSLVAAVLVAASVHAADRSAASTSSLVTARDRVAASARNTKGIPRAELDFERQRLNRLIDALESGENVSPAEIERELGRAQSLAR